jgi:hypothetical protein
VIVPRDGTLVEDDRVQGDASLEHALEGPSQGVDASSSCQRNFDEFPSD